MFGEGGGGDFLLLKWLVCLSCLMLMCACVWGGGGGVRRNNLFILLKREGREAAHFINWLCLEVAYDSMWLFYWHLHYIYDLILYLRYVLCIIPDILLVSFMQS